MMENLSVIDVLLVEDDPGDVAPDQGGVRGQQGPQRACTSSSDGEEALDFLHRRGEHAERAAPGPRPARPQPAAQGRPRGARGDQGRPGPAHDPGRRADDLRGRGGHPAHLRPARQRYVTKPVDFDHFIEVVRQIDDFFVTVVKLPNPR